MKKIKFDNFVRLARGFDLPDTQIVDGAYPVVTSTNIKAYHNEYKVVPPVVITGRSGSLGKVQFIDEKCWPLNTALYSKSFRNNNPKYVYYYLQTMHLENYNAGVGVPTLNQNHLHNLKIYIHDIDEQAKIVHALSMYDSLISTNNKRIKILEQMAENIYKEWFVRFRFPGYEKAEFVDGVPKGWEYIKLGKICSFCYGKMPKTEHLVKDNNGYAIFSGYNITGYYDTYMYDSTKLVLIARGVGGTGNVVIAPAKTFITNLSIIFNFNNEDLVKEYLYQRFKVNNLKYLDTGAAQSQITIENLKSVKVLIPGDEYLAKYNEFISVIQREINIVELQNKNLIKQRDLLLPRLMSGKLEIG